MFQSKIAPCQVIAAGELGGVTAIPRLLVQVQNLSRFLDGPGEGVPVVKEELIVDCLGVSKLGEECLLVGCKTVPRVGEFRGVDGDSIPCSFAVTEELCGLFLVCGESFPLPLVVWSDAFVEIHVVRTQPVLPRVAGVPE